MFIAPPSQLIRLALAAMALAAAAAAGWTVNGWRLGKQIEQATAERAAQDLAQSEANQEASRRRAVAQRKADDAYEARIRSIGGQLADALERVRSRPDRLPEAERGACAGSTGAELSGRDAGAFERLAARADFIRAALDRCQRRPAADGSVEP